MTKKEAGKEQESIAAVFAALGSSLKEQQLNFLVAPNAFALEKEFTARLIEASQQLFPFVPPGKELGEEEELSVHRSAASRASTDFGFLATRPVFPVQFAIDRFQEITVAEYLGISSQLSEMVMAKGCFSCPVDGGELLPPFHLKPYPSDKELEAYDFDSDHFLVLTVEVDGASQEFNRLVEVSGKESEASKEGVFRRLKLDTSNLASEIQRSAGEAMSQWGSQVFLRAVSAAELESGRLSQEEPLLSFRYSWQCSECGAVYPNPAKAGAEVSLGGMKLTELLSSRPEELIEFLEDYRENFIEQLDPLTQQLEQLEVLDVSLDYQLRELGRFQQVAVTMLKLSNLSMSAGVCLLEFLPADLSAKGLEQLSAHWNTIINNENTLVVCVTEQEFKDLDLVAKHPKAGVIKDFSSAECPGSGKLGKPVKLEEESKEICLDELYELLEDREPIGLTAVVDSVWHSPEFSSRKKLNRLASVKLAGVKVAGFENTRPCSLVEQTGLLDHLAALFSRTPEARTLGLQSADFLSLSEGIDKVSRAGIKFSEILEQTISSIPEWSGDEYFCELLSSLWSSQGLGQLKLGEEFLNLNYRLRCQLDLAGLCLPQAQSSKSSLMLLKDCQPDSFMVFERLRAEGLDYSVLTRVGSVAEARSNQQGLLRYIVTGL